MEQKEITKETKKTTSFDLSNVESGTAKAGVSNALAQADLTQYETDEDGVEVVKESQLDAAEKALLDPIRNKIPKGANIVRLEVEHGKETKVGYYLEPQYQQTLQIQKTIQNMPKQPVPLETAALVGRACFLAGDQELHTHQNYLPQAQMQLINLYTKGNAKVKKISIA